MDNGKLTFLLMAGLPGAGKSTLSRALGLALQWHVIDKDRLKRVFLDQGMENDVASYVAYEQAFETASHMLSKEERSVILDSAALQKFITARAKEMVTTIPKARFILSGILCDSLNNLKIMRDRIRSSLTSDLLA